MYRAWADGWTGTSFIFAFFGNPGEEWGDKCMKRIQKSIKQDIWIFLLDIISVNASYVLALLIRFVVYKFRSMKKAFDFAQYGIRINQIGTIVASIKHQFRGFFLSDRLIAAP